jgi:hypothetical protein
MCDDLASFTDRCSEMRKKIASTRVKHIEKNYQQQLSTMLDSAKGRLSHWASLVGARDHDLTRFAEQVRRKVFKFFS